MPQLLNFNIDTSHKLSVEETADLQNMIQLLFALQTEIKHCKPGAEFWFSDTSVVLVLAMMNFNPCKEHAAVLCAQYTAAFNRWPTIRQRTGQVCGSQADVEMVKPVLAPSPPQPKPVAIQSRRKPLPGTSPLRQSYNQEQMVEEREAEFIAEVTRLNHIFESEPSTDYNQPPMKKVHHCDDDEHLRIESLSWEIDTLSEFVVIEESTKKRSTLGKVKILERKLRKPLSTG